MSKLACHVQKFGKSDVRGMQIHNQRESENSKNLDINPTKTELNYDLKNDESVNYTHTVNERLKDVLGDKTIRKDAVVLCSVLVTAENEFFKDMPVDQQKKFFESAHKYLEDRFGKDNVIASMVHNDEKTPHLHFQFVPITEDGRLCAKELTSRKNLKELQNDLPKALQGAGFAIERGEEGSKAKHKDTEEWKREQLAMKSQALDVKMVELGNVEITLDKVQEIQRTAKEVCKGQSCRLSTVDGCGCYRCISQRRKCPTSRRGSTAPRFAQRHSGFDCQEPRTCERG